MPPPLRTRDPDKIHLVTTRTLEAALWMVPTKALVEIVGGVLARYQQLCGIVIFAYAVMGNHYHLLAQAPGGNLAEFCEQINREISRRVNYYLGRRGHFWGRRYSDQVVVEDTDALEAFLYITTNPVKHGLVKYARDWPGLVCFDQALSGRELEFSFTHYTEYRRAQRRGERPNIEHHKTWHKLVLTPLPQFKDLSQGERGAMLRGLISERERMLHEERNEQGRGFLGVKGVLQTQTGMIPKEVSYSPRPCCYTKSSQSRREFRREERYRRDFYDIASQAFRLGHFEAEFPIHCFKPPLHKAPRAIPFVSMAVSNHA